MPITHAFTSAVDDGVDDTVVQPSDWNADHIGSNFSVQEVDGTPNVAGVVTMIVPNGSLTDNTGGSVSVAFPTTYYPYHVEVNIFMPKAFGGTWVTDPETALIYAGRVYSTAQNDYIEWDVLLAAGTWKISIMGQKGGTRGIITASIDGSSIGTVDYYNASVTSNEILTITGISVATSGIKALRFTGATKHASSSDYLMFLQMVVLNRTGA
jgi:hypothetical protein